MKLPALKKLAEKFRDLDKDQTTELIEDTLQEHPGDDDVSELCTRLEAADDTGPVIDEVIARQ